jgi:magnesium-transporting ATPase (P-type)
MNISLEQILPSALVLLIASVPVALPSSFTLTTSLGAQELARSGILVNCLSAGISVYLTNPSMSGEQPESDSNRPVTGKSFLVEKMGISGG